MALLFGDSIVGAMPDRSPTRTTGDRQSPRLAARLTGLGAAIVAIVPGPAALAQALPQPQTAPAASNSLSEQDPRGFYGTLGAGVSWPQAIQYNGSFKSRLAVDGTVQPDPGFASELGLGYDFGRLRSELTWLYRQSAIGSSNWSIGPYRRDASSDTTLNSNSVFASLYLDLPLKNSRFVPYLGGGLGVTALQVGQSTIKLPQRDVSFSGGGGTFWGYQAKAGIAFRSSPRTDLFAEAVYQGAPGRTDSSLDRSALNSWGARLGLRYRFGGGTQPVSAPAAP